MTIRVALTVAALIATPACAQAKDGYLERGQSGFFTSTVLACPTRDGLAKVLKVSADTNVSAGVAQGMAEGCESFDKGTEVFVVEVPTKTVVCAKPKGKKECWWTAANRIQPTD
ncbi:exported hypothetical protein [Bradyrhizobium sp. ORS 375]|uniref:hypothetical protein n=1 Tax=Bradyrhizobium sp. (strain ORS 375) TaxID=566679 RepID=UPI0002406F18|nr:hypothetical protein [Bradyrhizobium sp. ORS 375]CCD94701.1 exported hypothetical protein [Bradyrhizobium sp. ORS 375]